MNDYTGTIDSSDEFEGIPAELRALRQWVCWKLETVNGRKTKVPYSPDGSKADATDQNSWSSFDECLGALDKNIFSGLGFVFAKGGEFTGIDFDKRRDPITGQLDEFTTQYISQLNSYSELSQSGSGIHVIVRGKIPSKTGRRDPKQGIEMYSHSRFFVMTGRRVKGTPGRVEPRQNELEKVFREIFPEKRTGQAGFSMTAPAMSYGDVIDRAIKAKNGTRFSALWQGNVAQAGYLRGLGAGVFGGARGRPGEGGRDAFPLPGEFVANGNGAATLCEGQSGSAATRCV